MAKPGLKPGSEMDGFHIEELIQSCFVELWGWRQAREFRRSLR